MKLFPYCNKTETSHHVLLVNTGVVQNGAQDGSWCSVQLHEVSSFVLNVVLLLL